MARSSAGQPQWTDERSGACAKGDRGAKDTTQEPAVLFAAWTVR